MLSADPWARHESPASVRHEPGNPRPHSFLTASLLYTYVRLPDTIHTHTYVYIHLHMHVGRARPFLIYKYYYNDRPFHIYTHTYKYTCICLLTSRATRPHVTRWHSTHTHTHSYTYTVRYNHLFPRGNVIVTILWSFLQYLSIKCNHCDSGEIISTNTNQRLTIAQWLAKAKWM